MDTSPKTVADSRCVMTEIILPNDTNGLGVMMGGKLMLLMDKAAGVTAMRHANCVCVTASADSIEFQEPIFQNDIIIIESWINRAFRSSMEIEIVVMAEDVLKKTRRTCNRAFFTFVALDTERRPTPVPTLHIETPTEQIRYKQAALRREARLCFFSDRLTLKDTDHTKDDLLAAIASGNS